MPSWWPHVTDAQAGVALIVAGVVVAVGATAWVYVSARIAESRRLWVARELARLADADLAAPKMPGVER